MGELIEKSYGSLAASRHLTSELDTAAIRQIVALGDEVLSMFPYHPLICTFINSCWALRVIEEAQLPAYAVAGSLTVGKYKIFNAEDEMPIADLIASFDNESKNKSVGWSGHIWCDFNGLVGDASIFLTGQINPRSMLFRVSAQNLYPEHRFVLRRPEEITEMSYIPHHVLTPKELAALVKGAANHLAGMAGHDRAI